MTGASENPLILQILILTKAAFIYKKTSVYKKY
jgi:hypothetical protein